MYLLTLAQPDFISEREKDSKEFARFLIPLVCQSPSALSKSAKEALQMLRIEIHILKKNKNINDICC